MICTVCDAMEARAVPFPPGDHATEVCYKFLSEVLDSAFACVYNNAAKDLLATVAA
jgi:hypothetical protein